MGGGAVMFDIDKLFTTGGAENYDSGYGSRRAYVIDMSGNQTVVTRLSNMRFPRVLLNVVVLPNGCIVVLGGQAAVELFSDQFGVKEIEMYCPSTQTWSQFDKPLTTARTYHSVGVLLKDGRVLSGGGGLGGGGGDYEPWNHPNVEIVTPPYLLDSNGLPLATRPTILEGPTTFASGGQINVTMDTASPHTFALMRLGSSTHTVNLDQRRVPLTVVSQVGAVFTLKIPTNPVHAPPGLYWLFALDSNGVPSVGWDVKGLPL
jgi:galactose oxidase